MGHIIGVPVGLGRLHDSVARNSGGETGVTYPQKQRGLKRASGDDHEEAREIGRAERD
jgi:hypothetical protein